MMCFGCGNQKAYKTYSGNGWEYCNQCGNFGTTSSDIFWDGKPEHGLADDPQTGKPRTFGSREEKARYLKAKGLVEAGDRVHGSFPSVLDQQHRPDNARESARQALAHVSQMGQDVRRREFNRILNRSR